MVIICVTHDLKFCKIDDTIINQRHELQSFQILYQIIILDCKSVNLIKRYVMRKKICLYS